MLSGRRSWAWASCDAGRYVCTGAQEALLGLMAKPVGCRCRAPANDAPWTSIKSPEAVKEWMRTFAGSRPELRITGERGGAGNRKGELKTVGLRRARFLAPTKRRK